MREPARQAAAVLTPEAARAERAAQIAAMTAADWKFIETVIAALRKRYPPLQIEVGRW